MKPLRAIQNLDCSADFNQRNLAPVSTSDNRGLAGSFPALKIRPLGARLSPQAA
jgi:hypothetical protein